MKSVRVCALTLLHMIDSVHHVAAGDRFARQWLLWFKVRFVVLLQAAEGSICGTIHRAIFTIALDARAGAVAVISPCLAVC